MNGVIMLLKSLGLDVDPRAIMMQIEAAKVEVGKVVTYFGKEIKAVRDEQIVQGAKLDAILLKLNSQ